MSDLFIKIFNLGVTAGWLVLAILICRPLMKRAPKWINCLLWGIVGLRLVFPFSLESIFSLVPSAEPLPQDIALSPAPEINSGVGVLNDAINPIISTSLVPTVGASINPMQIVIAVASWIWVIGIALMLGYGIVSYISLRFRVRVSVKGAERVYFCDDVDSPFILGVIRPRIYVPSVMRGEALEHVLAHEKAHLRRGDHLWKPVGFALLALYWFNPLLWVAYALLCRDIEAACDEKVIKEMSDEAKKGYSEALLACSLHRKRIMACPLAFGEVGVKQRIKSVLNYKKPAFWVIIVALAATLVLSVCFLTNPKDNVRDLLEPGSEWHGTDGALISAKVESGPLRMTGHLTFGNEPYDVLINLDYEGSTLYADVLRAEIADAEYDSNGMMFSSDEYNAWYDALANEKRLLRGRLEAHRGELVLKIKEDNLGLEEKRIVLKKTKDASLETVPLSVDGETRYVRITDSGSSIPSAKISAIQVKRDGDDVIFVLKWKNNSFRTQIYGESFEVYRYESDELIQLEFISYWLMRAVGVGARKLSYPSFNITEHYDISAPGKYRFECNGAWVEFEVVREEKQNTSDFTYDSSKKYDVYVWQMGKGGFSFALLESKKRDWLDRELFGLKGVDTSEMRQILIQNNLGPNDVKIVPWQNPLSSYIGDYWMNWVAMEDTTPQKNLYLAMVHDMLFGASERIYYPLVYESTYFDIDGDGAQELNKVALGLDGDKFTLRYMISEDGRTLVYDDTYEITPMSVKLFTDDGNLRLRGVTEDGATHIYAVTLEGGHVKLTEIEDTKSRELIKKLDLSEIDLSLVDRIVVTNGQTGKRAYLNKWLDKVLFQTILDTVKKIEATAPVSSRGYYGFTYHVELYYDYQTVFSFSICPEANGASITCGYYETVGGIDYPARYKLTAPDYDHLAAVLANCFK